MNLKRYFVLVFIQFINSLCFSQCTVQGVEITAFLADPNSGTHNFDTDRDGTARDDDEFVQICNTTKSDVTLTGFRLDDVVSSRYTFTSGDIIPANECLNIISDWRNTLTSLPKYFRDINGGAIWNNAGDSIILTDGKDSCVIDYFSGNTPKQSGCATLIQSGNGTVDCSLTPVDLNNSTLPINLIHFTADRVGSDVQIKWVTAQEIKNDFFTIERSIDGMLFYSIADVPGAGNSTSISEYTFLDENSTKASFYRLKQTDYDGSFSYSDVVKTNKLASQIWMLENSSQVVIKNVEGEEISYILLSTSGDIILSSKAVSDLKIDKSTLQPGVYIFQLTGSFGQKLFKIRTF